MEEAAILRWQGREVHGRTIQGVPWTPWLNGTHAGEIRAVLRPAFAVCSHDDAPPRYVMDGLPATRWYSAGGRSGLGVPIPLVASSEPPVPQDVERDILWCFVGSDTHPIRRELFDACEALSGPSVCAVKPWSSRIPTFRVEQFGAALARSTYTLAPRGYGPTSYRLYEALRAGSVPVYVSDVHWLPYADEIDWDRLAIVETDPHRAARRMVDELHLVADRVAYAREHAHRWTVAGVLDWVEADLGRHLPSC
jgi:hypothetical protein